MIDLKERAVWKAAQAVLYLVLIGLMLLPALTVQGQEENQLPEEVAARIDQAMAHLSAYLGRTVNRQNAFWFWAEKYYPDTGLDCPAEGQTYSQVLTRGYRIRIQTQDVEYDYRTTADGTVMVLCINGRPDPSSFGITVPPVTNPPTTSGSPTTVKQLPVSAWWAWVYTPENDTLTLLNPSGDQATLRRPRLPNEPTDPTINPQLAFSRDGRYLVVAAELKSGIYALGLYSFESGTFTGYYEAGSGELIHLGFGYGTLGASPYIFDPASQQFAVGFSKVDYTPASAWRVMVFEVATGNPLYQIDNANPLIAALGEMPGGSSDGYFFPSVVYFDTDSVHVHLIPSGTEGGPSFATFNWRPNVNQAFGSPYYLADIDILPTTGLAVFPIAETNAPLLPPYGPFTSYNAIAQGTPSGSPPGPQTIWTDGTKYHFNPRWAAGGGLVLFLTEDAQGVRNWNALNVTSRSNTVLPATIAAVHPTTNGFLSISVNNQVAFHNANNVAVGAPLWQPVNPETGVQALWASPPGSTFALTSITLPGAAGTVVCPNTIPSRMQVGGRGRVTFFDGQPLRLRATPNGNILDQMPEGTEFDVIGGPDCTGGRFTWYQVRLADGTIGWSAEGSLEGGVERYYMEPWQ